MSLGSSLGFLKAYGTGKRFFIFLVVVYLSVCFLFRLSQTGQSGFFPHICTKLIKYRKNQPSITLTGFLW